MAFIEILDLNAAGSDLFAGADSFLNELQATDSRQIFGGGWGGGWGGGDNCGGRRSSWKNRGGRRYNNGGGDYGSDSDYSYDNNCNYGWKQDC